MFLLGSAIAANGKKVYPAWANPEVKTRKCDIGQKNKKIRAAYACGVKQASRPFA